jgi:hypothetical protein
MRQRGCTGARLLGVVAVLAGVATLAGCATAPGTVPPAALELLSADPLVLPPDCEPGHGVVYRTAFVVQPDGRVASVNAESGAGCVQDALREWVSTFQYRPVAAAMAAVVDWMGVTAARGG